MHTISSKVPSDAQSLTVSTIWLTMKAIFTLAHLTIQMYAYGLNFRQIGRHLKVSHTTVMSWVKEHAEKLPEALVPEGAYTVEMDELYTFIEEKKTGSTSWPL